MSRAFDSGDTPIPLFSCTCSGAHAVFLVRSGNAWVAWLTFPRRANLALLEETHLGQGGFFLCRTCDGIQFVTISFVKGFQVCAHSTSWPVIVLSCLWLALESD